MATQRATILAAIVCVVCFASGCSQKPEPPATSPAPAAKAPSVELIIRGGPILTMEGDKPAYVEAVVVADGKIAFAGSEAEAMSRKSAGTVVKDLGGKTMLPGFVDAHSHFINAPTLTQQVNVSPSPVGAGDTVPQIIAALKEWQAKAKVPEGRGGRDARPHEAGADDVRRTVSRSPMRAIRTPRTFDCCRRRPRRTGYSSTSWRFRVFPRWTSG